MQWLEIADLSFASSDRHKLSILQSRRTSQSVSRNPGSERLKANIFSQANVTVKTISPTSGKQPRIKDETGSWPDDFAEGFEAFSKRKLSKL